ncbi:cysteine desulfurase [Clostridia bacterium]|nr:cysteine desulfurase [Clostridia bacterium]
MIYLDNGATTFPKPPQVISAVGEALKSYSANPGRSGHKLSLRASQEIYNCRLKLAEMFGISKEENVIFTQNCTHGINTVLHGYLKEGDHVVISNLEHNSVTRPLTELANKGITFTQAQVYAGNIDATLNSFKNAINEKTKLIVCTHASNVFGIRIPVHQIASLCHQYGIKVLVDGAQSAGVLPINVEKMGIDFLALAGHKGLYGPMGTGVLIMQEPNDLASLSQGGTGSSSASYSHPNIMPDKFESGTPNLPGIVGLSKGIDFIKKNKIDNIAAHEINLVQRLYNKLIQIDKIILYTPYPVIEDSVPVVSFNVKGIESEGVADYLNRKYDIATRAGLHCAPSAHIFMNTLDTGTVRISPSFFNTAAQIDTLVEALVKIK